MNAPLTSTVAFLDIGSNAIRLQVVRFHPSRPPLVRTQRRESVRLGAGVYTGHKLTAGAIREAVAACRRLLIVARNLGAESVRAIATSALREAANSRILISRLRRELDLRVQIISGSVEARLIYLGVARNLPFQKPVLMLDIGGGSTEVMLGDRQTCCYAHSLNLGAIRLSRRFLAADVQQPVTPAGYRRLQTFVRRTAAHTLRHLRRHPLQDIVGGSGTILNLADMAARMTGRRGWKPYESIPLTRLHTIIRKLCALPLTQRRRFPGIQPERADIIIGGAVILETLMQELHLKSLIVTPCNLRDGLVVEYQEKLSHLRHRN